MAHISEITLNNGVRGTLNQPAHDRPVPAVLMLHGFASHRHEVGDLYRRLADALAALGIASLRIDFRGWGESSGQMVDSTVRGQIEDARAAAAWLLAQPFTDDQRMGLIGFSMGGTIAIHIASDERIAPRSLVLWSSTHDLSKTLRAELGEANAETAAREGRVTIDLGFRTVTLGHNFFATLNDADITTVYPRYTGTFMVIAGSEDFSALSLDFFRESARGGLKASYRVAGADHIFNVLSANQAISEEVIAKTAAWFAMTL